MPSLSTSMPARADALALALPAPVLEGRYVAERIVCDKHGAVVLAGSHRELGTRVAIKLVDPVETGPRRRSAEPGREARITASLGHPNIVRVLDHGPGPWGGHCTVFAWAPGEDLDTLLDRRVALGARRALRTLAQLAAALDHAHGRGVVHGDVTPGNVRIDRDSDDFVTLVDFGISRETTKPSMLWPRFADEGTWAYLAPECAVERRGPTPASDRWSLAAIALEIVTGERPYPDAPPTRALELRRRHPPRLPSDVGVRYPGLDAVFERALARRPGARHPSAHAFVAALDACVLGPPREVARPLAGCEVRA